MPFEIGMMCSSPRHYAIKLKCRNICFTFYVKYHQQNGVLFACGSHISFCLSVADEAEVVGGDGAANRNGSFFVFLCKWVHYHHYGLCTKLQFISIRTFN